MQIAAEMRRSFVKKGTKVSLDDFKISFDTVYTYQLEEEEETEYEEEFVSVHDVVMGPPRMSKEKTSLELSKSRWFGITGFKGKPND